MKIQLRLTKEIQNMTIDELCLNGKASNFLKRFGCQTVEDVVYCWDKFGSAKGIGQGTINAIHNAVVNIMIQNLPDEELIKWFNYLLDNNTNEALRSVVKGFDKLETSAA